MSYMRHVILSYHCMLITRILMWIKVINSVRRTARRSSTIIYFAAGSLLNMNEVIWEKNYLILGKFSGKLEQDQPPMIQPFCIVALPKFLVTIPGLCSYVSKSLFCLIFITFISKDPSTVPKQQTVVEETTAVSFFSLTFHRNHISLPGTADFYSSLLKSKEKAQERVNSK